MENNCISFENDYDKGKYARDISWLLGQNNLNWWASASVKKPEIFIRPKDPPEENLRAVSRISLQIKDNSISFGVSGYYPNQIKEIRRILEERGYSYHKKEYNKYGKREDGRWWLTKQIYNIDSLVGEFREIEPIIFKKVFN